MRTFRKRQLFPIVRDYLATMLKRDRALERDRLHHVEMYEERATRLYNAMSFEGHQQMLAAVLSRRTGRFL